MKNKVRMYVYLPGCKYVPVDGADLPGYPVGDGKGRSYKLVEAVDESKFADGQLLSLINVRFEQPRNEGVYRASFGTLIPNDREDEFLDFMGVSRKELPSTIAEAVVFEVELDGIYDHHIQMKNIHEIYYAGKTYELV